MVRMAEDQWPLIEVNKEQPPERPENIVARYIAANPRAKISQIVRDTGLTRMVVRNAIKRLGFVRVNLEWTLGLYPT